MTIEQSYVRVSKVMLHSSEVITEGAKTTNTNTENVANSVAQNTNTVSLQDAVNNVLNKELPTEEQKPQVKKVSTFKRVSSANALKNVPLSDTKKEELEAFWIENFVSETPQGFEATITPELAHYVVNN